MIKKWKKFNEELDEDKIKKLRGVYNDLISYNNPDNSAIVGWRSHRNQEARFEVLLKYVKSGDSILDYGCGVGDLSKFIKDKGLDYIGIDINDGMVEIAKKKYPENQFFTMNSAFDFEKYDYDWFVASGVFSNYMTVKEMISVIKPAFDKANKGLAINFLLSEKIYPHGCPEIPGYLRGYDPDKLSNLFKKEISNNVETVIGYVPDDFTLILKK